MSEYLHSSPPRPRSASVRQKGRLAAPARACGLGGLFPGTNLPRRRTAVWDPCLAGTINGWPGKAKSKTKRKMKEISVITWSMDLCLYARPPVCETMRFDLKPGCCCYYYYWEDGKGLGLGRALFGVNINGPDELCVCLRALSAERDERGFSRLCLLRDY